MDYEDFIYTVWSPKKSNIIQCKGYFMWRGAIME